MQSNSLRVMTSRGKTYDYSTPKDLFEELNKEFHFTLDVCADKSNTKCSKFFDEQIDGLKQDWKNETCWMNPPYCGQVRKWIAKARDSAREGATVVCLVPSRTDMFWFHDFVLDQAEIRFIKGRLKFGNAKHSAPFPSMIIIFRPGLRS